MSTRRNHKQKKTTNKRKKSRKASGDQSGQVRRIIRNPRNGPFGQVYPTTLHYSDYIDVNVTSGTLGYNLFRANSLYDPDSTGTGHQPIYFDTFAALYSKYRVTALRYSFRVAPPNGDSECSMELFSLVRNGLYTPAYPTIAELPYAKHKVTGAFSDTITVSDRVNLTTLSAPRPVYMYDDRYAAVVTTNPVEVINLVLALICSRDVTVRVYVDIYYECQFYDPEPPSSSLLMAVPSKPLKKKKKVEDSD
jgi:hypothetical protein